PIQQIQGSANILCVHVPNIRRVLFCHSFQEPVGNMSTCNEKEMHSIAKLY
ncbi:6755_t:CDS:1, partial [Scutellospora calospora]